MAGKYCLKTTLVHYPPLPRGSTCSSIIEFMFMFMFLFLKKT